MSSTKKNSARPTLGAIYIYIYITFIISLLVNTLWDGIIIPTLQIRKLRIIKSYRIYPRSYDY